MEDEAETIGGTYNSNLLYIYTHDCLILKNILLLHRNLCIKYLHYNTIVIFN
jgi:hypothetical protein